MATISEILAKLEALGFVKRGRRERCKQVRVHFGDPPTRLYGWLDCEE